MLPMFLAVIDQTIVATALPSIASELQSVEWTSGIVVGYLIAATILSPVYGRLGDAFGRRKLLFIALGIFVGASVLCALADSIGTLIAARVLQGVGGSGLMSLSQALIGEAVRPRDRARFQGFLAGVAVTSNTLGPVVGGLLTQYFGWRSIFLVNVPVGLLAVLLLARLPVRNVAREPFQFDGMGLLLFALMVTSLLGALQELQRFDFAVFYVVVTLMVVAVVALFLLYRWEKRAPDPLLPLSLLRDRSIWRSDAMAACHGATLVSLLTFLPIYFRTVHGSDAAEIGLLMAPMTIAIAIGSMLTGTIVARTGHSAILPSLGTAATAIALVLLSLVSPVLTPRAASLVLACATFFMGSVMSVVQVTVQTAAGPSQLGRAASSVQLSRALGAALGTATVSLAIFATISLTDPQAIAVFSALLEAGPDALSTFSPAMISEVASGIGSAFRVGFLLIAAFAAISSVLAWTLPMRRIE
ncbi:MAG TPA: MFS transporter [Dongiaceae bacterium]|nr:MFS transporter [Dongiaceae bacterium]